MKNIKILPKGLFYVSLGGNKKKKSNLKKANRLESDLVEYLHRENLIIMAFKDSLHFVPLKEEE